MARKAGNRKRKAFNSPTPVQQLSQLVEVSAREKQPENMTRGDDSDLREQLEKLSKENSDLLQEQKLLSESLMEARLKYRSSCQSYSSMKNKYLSEKEKSLRFAKQLAVKEETLTAMSERLEFINSSISFQLGVTLVGAARQGVKGLIKLPAEILRLYKLSKPEQRSATRLTLSDMGGGNPPGVTGEYSSESEDKQPLSVSEQQPPFDEAAVIAEVPKVEHSKPKFRLGATSAARKLSDLKVAAIMDEFTYHSFAAECNLLQLTPDNWKVELDVFRPDLLFIESAWRGKDELWKNQVGKLPRQLIEILDWCNQHGVRTAFWNKEDPIHFETFLNVAKKFDAVFTTDIDCIARYKTLLGHSQVYLLPFAAQPAVHNPLEAYERLDAFSFAGAYYVRYPDRTRDLENFVKTIPDYRPLEIYDRNFGKDDPNYMFPDEFKKHIVGTLPFEQIDKAYKGYRYAINLNSIKNSQTMFARRVYELLASNTFVVSNYSRGVRLMFGDLVSASDSGSQHVETIKKLKSSVCGLDGFQLLGVRKALSQHAYQDRLAYVHSKLLGSIKPDELWPEVTVIGWVENNDELDVLLESFSRQSYGNKKLILFTYANFTVENTSLPVNVTVHDHNLVAEMAVSSYIDHGWVAIFNTADHYGAEYLTDMMLATRYSSNVIITKNNFYSISDDGGCIESGKGHSYKLQSSYSRRRSICHVSTVEVFTWECLKADSESTVVLEGECVSVDRFNYCENGKRLSGNARSLVDAALDEVKTGLDIGDILDVAEFAKPTAEIESGVKLDMGDIGTSICGSYSDSKITIAATGPAVSVKSSLAENTHFYVYSRKMDGVANLEASNAGLAKVHFECSPGLDISLVMIYFDQDGARLSHVILTPNRNHTIQVPSACTTYKLGFRVYGPGSCIVKNVWADHVQLVPANMLMQGEHLVLTNHYPSYENLYRNGFVHKRVLAYRERGSFLDVMRFRAGEFPSYHEFEGVDCLSGGAEVLEKLICGGTYKSVLVHFLDASMWSVLKRYLGQIKVIIWIHGSEVQPLHRREYNYTDEAMRQKAQKESDERMDFWREVFSSDVGENLKFVFVSKYFAEEVMEDVGVALDESSYDVIHNPIDTELFSYVRKSADQRFNILSIRPFASRKYANDLSVKAILDLIDETWFDELNFTFYGDGALFDEVLEPVKHLSNVSIIRGFLSQKEIARIHKDFGVFLCPTRMDAQGVSRDEAMSSGLVPITNAVAAIPEFVDSSCGFAVSAEGYKEMADAIRLIVNNPNMFLEMSGNARDRVVRQSSSAKIVPMEIGLFEKKN